MNSTEPTSPRADLLSLRHILSALACLVLLAAPSCKKDKSADSQPTTAPTAMDAATTEAPADDDEAMADDDGAPAEGEGDEAHAGGTPDTDAGNAPSGNNDNKPNEGTCGGQECSNSEYCVVDNPAHCIGPGSCKPRPKTCPKNLAEVCGCDGKTYENTCYANREGVTVVYTGPCKTINK